MKKEELITIIVNIIFLLSIIISIPMLLRNGDYLILVFLSISCIISIYNCWIFIKKKRNNYSDQT